MESSNFDPKLVAYLRQADATFRNKFENEDMQTIFLDNVFEEIIGSEVKLSLMKSASFIMEQFIAAASAENILQLFKSYSSDFKEVSENQQGCHVVQKLLQRFTVLLNNSKDTSSKIWSEMYKIISSFAEYLTNETELIEWMSNTYSSHIVRSLVDVFGGYLQPIAKNSRERSNNDEKEEIVIAIEKLPNDFLEAFNKIVASFNLLEKQRIVELLSHQSGTPCICCMLRIAALRSPKMLKLMCSKILSACDANDWSTLLILSKDKTASHAVERLIEYGDKLTCLKLHEIFCDDKERLLQLACHPVTNFVIQKLIISKVLSDKFEGTLDCLLEGLEDILAERRYGVIQKLAEQCIEVDSCQSKFLSALLEAFHCKEAEQSKYIVSLVASFTTYDVLFSQANHEKIPPLKNVLYHGSLLLQTLLQFGNPEIIAKSFTSIPPQHSVEIACDVSGSHLIDAFFAANSVSRNWKKRYVEHIKDHIYCMACDKYGSRVLDNLWKTAMLKIKTMIVENLVAQRDVVIKDNFGKHIFRNFGVKQFIERQDQWREFQLKQAKKRKMFDELLSKSTNPVSSKKKKRH